MNKGHSLVELRPNRLLLDPSFEGYKLSLDPIPVYRKTINSGVKVVQPGDDQYSFYHVKIFSLHNHLHANQYKPNSIYFIDKNWTVFKVISSPPYKTISLTKVFQIPNNQQQKAEIYHVSIVFASSDLVIISDGMGALYMANIVNQKEEEMWECSKSGSLYEENSGYVLSDARIESMCGEKTLNVILLLIEEKKEEKIDSKNGLFQAKIKWRTFVEESNMWKEKCNKELYINGNVDYIALEPGCKSLYVISDKSPKWAYDSENGSLCVADFEIKPALEPKLYTWTQTEEDITISIPLIGEIEKSDLVVLVDDLEMEVRVKEKLVMSGKFFHRVSKDLTVWILKNNQVEIQLTKHKSGLIWSALIPSDDRGEEILDPEIIQDVHEKLAHLCSDKEETGSAPTFNSQQLEECDVACSNSTSLFRVNGDTHLTTHQVSLSSLQYLSKFSCEANETPAICVRHDVDACVWQFKQPIDEKSWPHEHIGTFSAFGYVQASKTQKRFLASPPSLSYVAICEASHHIYIYRQPSPITSELKNRLTGKKVDTISKQQLVNLEVKDQILGVHATNELLFVLLENSVCTLVINA